MRFYYMWKMHYVTSWKMVLYIWYDCRLYGTKGQEYKLFKKRSRLDIRKFSLSNRVIDAWNSLPALCVNSATINCFKTHVSDALEPETVMWNLVIYDSRLYMAQACAHLCHLRRHLLMLGGSGESGEAEKCVGRIWVLDAVVFYAAWTRLMEKRDIQTERRGTQRN